MERQGTEQQEQGVDVPWERLDQQTLRNLISEFVTREWEELGDSHHTLEDKINQVMQQLRQKKAKVVFDLAAESCNIVPCDGRNHV